MLRPHFNNSGTGSCLNLSGNAPYGNHAVGELAVRPGQIKLAVHPDGIGPSSNPAESRGSIKPARIGPTIQARRNAAYGCANAAKPVRLRISSSLYPVMLFISVMLAGCEGGFETSAQPASSALAHHFRNEFTELNKQDRFNGVVLVADGERILYREALGIRNAAGTEELRPDAVFNLASVSKPITATAILILAEKGRLSLNDPAHKYVPEMKNWYKGADRITIKHLLWHTSGLPDYEELADDYFEQSEQEDPIQDFVDNSMIRAMFSDLRPEPLFYAGEEFSYSNTGYLLLADIVEKVSGQSFQVFLQQNLFRPLAMNSSSVCTAKNQPANKARGFEREGEERYEYDVEYLDGVYGDGNICSTADDLLKLDRALRKGTLLGTEGASSALEPGNLNNGDPIDYGYGWELQEGVSFHTGSWTGFRTYFIRYIDEGFTIIVLDNSSNEELYDEVDRIRQIIRP